MAQTFFFDNQIKRFLLQFTRIMSNFQVMYGAQGSENEILVRVPVRYGDWSRQAQTVAQNNSASTMPSAPIITFYIAGMDYDRPRVQEPYFVSKTQIRQRRYDPDTNTYDTTQGNAFTVERLMPVPYRMTINCDFWTSNTNQKLQLFEQVAALFNPALEIQSTDNYLDWTSLSVVELEQNTWTTRSIPQGTDDALEIMTMRFIVPIWISSPAKVKKLGVVERIIASMYDSAGDANEAIANSDLLLGTRQKITPYGYQVLLIGDRAQVLARDVPVNPGNSSLDLPQSPGSNQLWPAVLGLYGQYRPGITQLRLEPAAESGREIIGTVVVDPADARFLLVNFDPDTLPQNTLPPVTSVINPLMSGPGAGLPPAQIGQRYLILDDIGSDSNPVPAQAWGSVVARANDIIGFDGDQWLVEFASDTVDTPQFVTNITTGLQYRWTGQEWIKSYEGLYPGGEWSIVI
jgi:hypothetical protein